MRCCLSLGTLLLVITPVLASSQSLPPDRFFWELTPAVGVFVPEEPEESEIEAGALFGARGAYRRANGFGVELHGAYTSLDLEVAGASQPVDLPTFLYGVEGLYAWPVGTRADVFAALGFGGITWSADEDEGLDSETNPRLSFGGGAHVLLTRSLALRGDVRDHLIFDQLSDTARTLRIADKGNTNNLEVSVGLSLILQ
jgi:hypothetical protein